VVYGGVRGQQGGHVGEFRGDMWKYICKIIGVRLNTRLFCGHVWGMMRVC